MRFTKMSGAGNDFIVVEGRPGLKGPELARKLCPRRIAIGADGLLVLERGRNGSHRMIYYNADGSRAFCGNGSRCAAMWMRRRNWSGRNVSFQSDNGPLEAVVTGPERVRLRMPPATPPESRTAGKWRGFFLDTGVPHFVVPVKKLDAVDVEAVGRELRFHKAFAPKGANVNFVERGRIRTYERGVEAETLACGTGAVAAALAKGRSPVALKARSGDILKVEWTSLSDIWLEGPAVVTFEGES
jgi:diaminopimelate epimerase